MLINGEAKCLCRAGFTGSPSGISGCTDVDECANSPCGKDAFCRNQQGSFTCECPAGFVPASANEDAPYKAGCKSIAPPQCDENKPCPLGEQCVQGSSGQNVCACLNGFVRDAGSGRCRDTDECLEDKDKPRCGLNAVCKNLPGSYECHCPSGYHGNPFALCEECNSEECKCQPPYRIVNGTCVFGNCSPTQPCPPGADCISVTKGVSYCACPAGFATNHDGSCSDVDECTGPRRPCAVGAECINKAGSYECVCPPGYQGDAYTGACSAALVRCTGDTDCGPNEKCVQPGECICPPPFFTDTADGNKCKNPCERHLCGINAKCTPSDPPRCACEPGFEGNPNTGCVDIDECQNKPCSEGAICINNKGGYQCVCPKGTSGDPHGPEGCKGEASTSECRLDKDCPDPLKCDSGSCVNPCAAGRNGGIPCGDNAVCEPEGHAAWCRCLPGFEKGPGDKCVSACKGVLCGSNAQCIATVEGPSCACSEGFTGNAFPGGQCVPEVCSSSNPCEEPQICVGGKCKERCEDVICGVGATCDKNTNQCVCMPFYIGNPNLKCVPRKLLDLN